MKKPIIMVTIKNKMNRTVVKRNKTIKFTKIYSVAFILIIIVKRTNY